MKNLRRAPKAFYFKLLFVVVFTFLTLNYARADTFTTDLTVGSNGSQVVTLQTWLINHGFDIPAISSGVSVKGYFGNQTKAALIAYQESVGLPAFGYFGPLTRGRLNAIVISTGNTSLTVAYPNGGETWIKGTNQNIIWLSPIATTTTLVDIRLIPYQAPCVTQVCPMLMRAPIDVAAGIDINQHSYNWNVGSYGQGISYIPENPVPSIPDGQYSVQICVETTTYTNPSMCDSSDSTFTISGSVSTTP